MKPMLLLCMPTIGCLLLGAPAVRAQQPDEQVKRVFADWEKRREAIKRIRYTVVGHSIMPKGSTTDDYGRPMSPASPAADIPQQQDSIFLLDLPRKRFRLEMTCQLFHQTKQQLVPRVTINVFDGKSFATEMPREANDSEVSPRQPSDPDVSVARNYSGYRPLNTINAFFLSPLLLAHGLVPRLREGVDFDKRPDPDDFVVHGQHLHDGTSCVVLRTFPDRTGTRQTSFDEYWVDTARDSAVVRQSAYANDKLQVDIQITYQQTAEGWLPLRWTGTSRQGDQVINVTRLRVKEISVDPSVSDGAFQPDVRPGMNVVETIMGDPEKIQGKPPVMRTKSYHVAPDGSWNEVVNGVEQKSQAWLWYGLGGFVAASAVAAFVVWYMRRGRPRNRPGNSLVA